MTDRYRPQPPDSKIGNQDPQQLLIQMGYLGRHRNDYYTYRKEHAGSLEGFVRQPKDIPPKSSLKESLGKVLFAKLEGKDYGPDNIPDDILKTLTDEEITILVNSYADFEDPRDFGPGLPFEASENANMQREKLRGPLIAYLKEKRDRLTS